MYLTRQWKVLTDKCTPVGRTKECELLYIQYFVESFHNFNRCNTVHHGALFSKEWFPSVAGTMITLFGATTGGLDWIEVHAILEPLGAFAQSAPD